MSLNLVSIVFSVLTLWFLFSSVALTVHGQSELQTTKYRNLVIDLGNGLETNARLNLPVIGDGPYPAVLLVPGSGITDMNETAGYVRIDNDTNSIIYPSARPFFDIAQYLSERGFAVLQYDKRGVGANFTILDYNVWGNVTFDDLARDAQKALDVLLQQPDVDSSKVVLVGHSEGTTVVPRIAINNSDKVDAIVLMGTLAQNLDEIGYSQIMLPVLYAQQVLDHDHNGLISVKEASEDPVFRSLFGNLTLVLANSVASVNGTGDRLGPQYDLNNDTLISINDELKTRQIDKLKSISDVIPGEKCSGLSGPCPIWVNSQLSLLPNIDIINRVPSNISVLILQGENDSDTPLQQALILQQKLTELRHPDSCIDHLSKPGASILSIITMGHHARRPNRKKGSGRSL